MAKQTYEQMLQELEEIVLRLENGTPDLESSLKQYEKGIALLRSCRQTLTKAQRRIEVLAQVGPNGVAETTELEDAELTDQQKAQNRSSRRGYKSFDPNTEAGASAPAQPSEDPAIPQTAGQGDASESDARDTNDSRFQQYTFF